VQVERKEGAWDRGGIIRDNCVWQAVARVDASTERAFFLFRFSSSLPPLVGSHLAIAFWLARQDQASKDPRCLLPSAYKVRSRTAARERVSLF
jgi:hypothetical protein